MMDKTLRIIDNDIEKIYEIVKFVKLKDNNYVIYKDSNNELYASIYEVIDNEFKIKNIEDDDIYEILENTLGESNE